MTEIVQADQDGDDQQGEHGRMLAGMTDRQRLLIMALLEGKSISASWAGAGYKSLQSARVAVNGAKVAEFLASYRSSAIMSEGATVAIATMIDLCGDQNTGTVRLGAAKWLAEAAGHGKHGDGEADKELHEMTEAELASFIERQTRIVEAGGSPAIITVTDSIGPG
jgi:hypothetical protein